MTHPRPFALSDRLEVALKTAQHMTDVDRRLATETRIASEQKLNIISAARDEEALDLAQSILSDLRWALTSGDGRGEHIASLVEAAQKLKQVLDR